MLDKGRTVNLTRLGEMQHHWLPSAATTFQYWKEVKEPADTWPIPWYPADKRNVCGSQSRWEPLSRSPTYKESEAFGGVLVSTHWI